MNDSSPIWPSNGNARRSPWLLWVLFWLALIVFVGLLVWALNNGQYLQTRVSQFDSEERVEGTLSADEYAYIETHCQQQKQLHINECGYGYPEDDYHCRVEDANEVFETCINTTSIEDIDDNFQLSPGPEGKEFLPL